MKKILSVLMVFGFVNAVAPSSSKATAADGETRIMIKVQEYQKKVSLCEKDVSCTVLRDEAQGLLNLEETMSQNYESSLNTYIQKCESTTIRRLEKARYGSLAKKFSLLTPCNKIPELERDAQALTQLYQNLMDVQAEAVIANQKFEQKLEQYK